ncbi:flagellar protein FlgN [Caminicella sporogenes]|uniref:flagellar protein FlgN n=1 Tax=Caminicella sporogenes TaxID=166485 RepID=UPI0025410084|nr:flagellar protein FlgN [Caminicella sporogenes]WIF96128.1 flagellar protein FlgN [Caminicella sporogenes]
MNKSVEQLILTLNKEYDVYAEVLKLAKNKKKVIIEGKVKELDSITGKEQVMIVTLGKLEKIRESIVNNIIKEMEIKDEIENITELVEYFDDEEREKVLEIRKKLVEILDEVKKENNLNSELIKQSLEYIEFNKNLLMTLNSQGSTYGANADEKDVKVKTNLFDMKV